MLPRKHCINLHLLPLTLCRDLDLVLDESTLSQ